MGARTHHAHLAAQYVEQLRQFVDAGRADDAADTRDPVVVATGRAPALQVARLDAHAAKLVHQEQAVAVADALLAEEDRATAVELDRNRDDQQQRREKCQRDRRQQHVDAALDDPVIGAQRIGRHQDGR